tara:strand:- start:84 stop:593 length:510 start_codon:yes stop_codon:yes gene_type:complete
MSSSSLNWVVAQLKPNMLKKAELNLLRQSFEYYAPKELYTVRKGNLFKRVKKLLFPGYIFVKINILNRDLSTLGNTLGISKVLKSTNGKAATLPETFIQNLKKNSHINFNINQKQELKVGKIIKCIDGPFTGLIGQIYKLEESGRLKILFEIINGSYTVSLKTNKIALY